MAVRPFRSDDASTLVNIWYEAVKATHFFLTQQDIDFYYDQVRDIYLPQLDVWVYEDNGIIKGFIGFSQEDSNHKIEMLFVDPNFHGQRIGSSLITWAKRRIKGSILVDVNEENPAAHFFYLKKGFEFIGRSELDSSGQPFPIIHLLYQKKIKAK
ncbi:GNAT family N-acetyltransferase [Zophobihabitans entericus]|uniref:GNAT family N-acetyltransferase n=1 Tax=Zophobihabitans entericus TaxID=1635327 RepID=A0A6G9ICV7_9GAMM|nr:GNAT family N-acetyltransferase [Zophobihabitans entericus]QIQ22065.1 GNAT family N-acetyltransferase [Zophobihabitans entericus]